MAFGEKQMEWSMKHGAEVPVWQSPKYVESREKAVEIIQSGKYGLQESDFWILKNATKNGSMAYTGLIISHNGCLKINDSLTSKFDPESVSVDKDGYRGSLVFSYCNGEQGIFEVGEVSQTNCKNEYPYAMGIKRLFDRVVLKLSKLAYAGIYSDSEADEFAKGDSPSAKCEVCTECGGIIQDSTGKNGGKWPSTDIIKYTVGLFGRPLCPACANKLNKVG